jgi:hypothetical protein
MESLISSIAFSSTVVLGYIGCKQRLQQVQLSLQCDSKHNDSNNNDKASVSTTRLSSSSSLSSSSQRLSSFHLVRHLSSNSKWSEYSDDEESFVQDFPKVELHVVRANLFVTETMVNLLSYRLIESVSFTYSLTLLITPCIKMNLIDTNFVISIGTAALILIIYGITSNNIQNQFIAYR